MNICGAWQLVRAPIDSVRQLRLWAGETRHAHQSSAHAPLSVCLCWSSRCLVPLLSPCCLCATLCLVVPVAVVARGSSIHCRRPQSAGHCDRGCRSTRQTLIVHCSALHPVHCCKSHKFDVSLCASVQTDAAAAAAAAAEAQRHSAAPRSQRPPAVGSSGPTD